jgi:photosystem II stability/assembly factor-like uncharacterized protein
MICLLVLAALAGQLRVESATEGTSTAPVWPSGYRQDANLFDVCFVNAQLGWAVGDRGTILHTQDGGETWQLQETPAAGRLESVHFVDAQHGWAVGGSTTPYTHRSVGCVLRTDNGGQTWQRDPDQFLPWLTGVHFSDLKRGIAFGLPSAMFPSAVYHTRDGAHWTPWPGWSTGWVDAIVDLRGQGLLIDRSGQLVHLQAGVLTPLGKLKHESRLPLRMSDNGQGQWLLCGNQGLVQLSLDAGQHWIPPRGLPDAALLSEFDWQAVESHGPDAWIVGVPGSCCLTTHDGGTSWQLLETGNQLPLYALDFVDSQHGWAVGALGTVLMTQDGGESWTCQRSAGAHLAVLGVFGQAEQIPWELVGQMAAGEGYWTRVEVLADSAGLQSKSGETPTATRLHEATVMAGGVGANLIQSLQAPDARLRISSERLRRQWDQSTQTDSQSQLIEYLVRQFRCWQPDLVVIAEPSDADDGLTRLIRQIVLQATEEAADTSRFGMQLQAGLSAWRVSRVTTFSDDAGGSGYPVSGNQLVLSLGQSVAQLADRARANLSSEYRPGTNRLTLRTLDGDSPARRGLFAPTQETSGRISRRTHVEPAEDVRLRNQQAQRRRTLDVLLGQMSRDEQATWQQAMHLAGELSVEQRNELLTASAAQQLRTGNASLAFELLNRVQQDSGPLPLRESARLRLFWYLASDEAALHWPLPELTDMTQVTQAAALQAGPGEVRLATLATPQPLGTKREAEEQPIPVTGTGPTADNALRRRLSIAGRLIDTIQAEQPDLYFEPMLRFPLAALHRRTGRQDAAVKFWRSQLTGHAHPAYRNWAASELALLEADALPSRPCWHCPRLQQPPRLDGRLNDSVWQTVAPTELQSAAGTDDVRSTTHVRLAYDAEFLYVAVQADKSSALEYSPGEQQTRRRDEVLDGDRIEIYLDVDHDAVTHWCLTIDYRGWASERLNDDPTWNPQWYIAADQSATTWTVEAAIPLKSLSSLPVAPEISWCLGIQRIMPGQEWETWLQPAPIDLQPEEFGLLRFQ